LDKDFAKGAGQQGGGGGAGSEVKGHPARSVGQKCFCRIEQGILYKSAREKKEQPLEPEKRGQKVKSIRDRRARKKGKKQTEKLMKEKAFDF